MLDAHLLVAVGADGYVDGVIFFAQGIHGDLVLIFPDGGVKLHLHAGGEDGVDVLLQALSRQTVAGNAVEKHAAQIAALLENGDLVAHELQVVGGA